MSRRFGRHFYVMGGCAAIGAAFPHSAGAQTRIPPSGEFSVPKAPTVALSDSGAFLSYELHVTNLTPTAMYLRRVEVLDANSRASTRAYVYLWIPVDANSYHGDPLKNENYYAYGTPLMAVADGVTAATKDSIPQSVPGANSRAVPITMTTVGGNYVAIDIGHGRYALYAHLQPGSLRVKAGDRVKRGQVIALLGNSGNSTEPHVHFQIADGPTFLSSEGIPHAMNFDVVGNCGVSVSNGRPPSGVHITRPSR